MSPSLFFFFFCLKTKLYLSFFTVGTIVINRFLCQSDDKVNISYDVQADFLKEVEMPFASTAVRKG